MDESAVGVQPARALAARLVRPAPTVFGGPAAELVYATLYRMPSAIVHASDYDRIVTRGPDGTALPLPIRGDAHKIQSVCFALRQRRP